MARDTGDHCQPPFYVLENGGTTGINDSALLIRDEEEA